MNREERIARKVAGKSKTAAYMATGQYKSLSGWISMVMKQAREVDQSAHVVLDDLQSPIDDSNKNSTMRNLGYLEGSLNQLIGFAKSMQSVVVETGKAVRDHTS